MSSGDDSIWRQTYGLDKVPLQRKTESGVGRILRRISACFYVESAVLPHSRLFRLEYLDYGLTELMEGAYLAHREGRTVSYPENVT